MQNRNNVRITDEAHILLAEKAGYFGTSMKEVASEAIVLLATRENKVKECLTLLDKANERITVLDARILNNSRHAFGAFVLGAIVAGCLMFAVGVTL